MDAVTVTDRRLVAELEARISADRARATRIRDRASELGGPALAPLASAMRRRASELELMVRAHEAICEGLVGAAGDAAA